MKSEIMPTLRRIVRVLPFLSFLLLMAGGLAHGQGLRVRFLCFGRIVGAEKLWLADSKTRNDGQEVELQLNNFVGPFRTQTRDLVLMERLAKEGQAPPEAVVKVTIPASLGSRILVILTPQGGKEGSYLAIPIRDDPAGFAPGERRFVNLTKFQIGGEFDGKRTLIKANTLTSVKLPAPPAGKSNHEVVFYYQVEQKWLPLSSSVWPFDPEARTLVFCFWSVEDKRIRFQSIAEVPTKEDPDGK